MAHVFAGPILWSHIPNTVIITVSCASNTHQNDLANYYCRGLNSCQHCFKVHLRYVVLWLYSAMFGIWSQNIGNHSGLYVRRFGLCIIR